MALACANFLQEHANLSNTVMYDYDAGAKGLIE